MAQYIGVGGRVAPVVNPALAPWFVLVRFVEALEA
jgi:hypothetical protein